MAIAITVGPSTGAITSGNNSFTIALTGTTSGESVVVGVAWQSAFTSVSSVDCSGQGLTARGTGVTSNSSKVQFFTLDSLSSGGDKTITITMSHNASANNQASAYAVTLSGTDQTGVYDAFIWNTATNSSPTIDVSTGRNNNAVFSLAVADSTTSGDFGAGSGYTLIAMTDSANRQFQGQYNVDTGTAGVKAAGFTIGGSQTWAVAAMSVNSASTSPTVTPGVGSLSLTGVAPTVGGDRSATPGTGALSFTGIAPTVSTSLSPSFVPDIVALSLTGYAPTVTSGNSLTASIDLLAHTASGEGYGGPVGAITLLGHSVSAGGVGGGTGTAAIDLLSLQLSAGGNESASITLLVHDVVAAGATGTIGSLGATFAAPSLTAQGTSEVLGEAANDLLYHSSSSAGLVGNTGSLSGTLAIHRIETVAFGGNVGTAAISLLLHTTSSVAFAAVTGEAAVTLAGHYIEAAGFPTLAESYRTWVLNLRNAALTEYDNFEFNSFAYFDGKYLAAGPGGVVELGTQELDGDEKIAWRVRTGSVDYDSTYLKRVPRVYVTGEFGGSVYFRTITSEDGERTYLLPHNGNEGDQQRRVPIGQGPKSLQWAYELEGINGCDVRISRLLPYPKEIKRRVA